MSRKKKYQRTMPTESQIMDIPLAKAGEYELSDRETRKTRRRIYGINKDNAAGRRYRTLRDGAILLVWRVR